MAEQDYFICPNCGEEVSIHAKRCPECGADDQHGWNEDAFHQGSAVMPQEDFDYEEIAKQLNRSRGRTTRIVVIAVIFLIVFIYYVIQNMF